MANEITFGWKTGKTLVYGAQKPDGTFRTPAGTSLPEIGSTSYFTADDADILAGDFVIVKDNATGKEVGQGQYQPTINEAAIIAEIDANETKIDALHDFDPDSDAVANVTQVDTTTTNTDMRGTDSAATEAKQDTMQTDINAILVDTGTTIPAQISSLNDFDPAADTVAHVTLVDTTTINTDMRGTDGANTTKTGYSLASDGLDSISITEPSGVASNFREMVVQVWRRLFKRSRMTPTTLVTYKDDNTTVVTTQTLAETDDEQIQGPAS